MITIMGFDISSKTIGWACLNIKDNKIQYVNSGYIKPNKTNDIISDLYKTRNEILKLIKQYKPNYISIEDIIQYMHGASTSKTIIKLTTFNRMVCLLSRDYLGSSPDLFNVLSIRHGIKENKKLPKKENIPDLVSAHLGITFPWELNNKNIEKEENFDRADAIAVALYKSFILIGKSNAPKKKQNKSSKKKNKRKI